jgi:hypothetical protein
MVFSASAPLGVFVGLFYRQTVLWSPNLRAADQVLSIGGRKTASSESDYFDLPARDRTNEGGSDPTANVVQHDLESLDVRDAVDGEPEEKVGEAARPKIYAEFHPLRTGREIPRQDVHPALSRHEAPLPIPGAHVHTDMVLQSRSGLV